MANLFVSNELRRETPINVPDKWSDLLQGCIGSLRRGGTQTPSLNAADKRGTRAWDECVWARISPVWQLEKCKFLFKHDYSRPAEGEVAYALTSTGIGSG